jgi:hypothetical protein
MKPVSQYEELLWGRLTNLTPRLSVAINELQTELTANPGCTLSFELEPAALTDVFPIHAFLMSKDMLQLNNLAVNNLNLRLKCIGPILTSEEQGEFIIWEKIDSGPHVHALRQPIDGVDNRLIIRWFSDVWNSTRSFLFLERVTLGIHDAPAGSLVYLSGPSP